MRLAALIPDTVVAVAESGIRGPDDVSPPRSVRLSGSPRRGVARHLGRPSEGREGTLPGTGSVTAEPTAGG